MAKFVAGIIFTLLVILIGGYFFVKGGYLDFRADEAASGPERHLAMAAMDESTERHAPDVKNPVPNTPENLVAGATLYMNHCAGCHGVPSNPDSQFAHSFNPPVPRFFKEAPDMPENQNYYIIAHGVRWTGMPAWGRTLNDTQMWQVVTFLSNIEKLPPEAQKVLEVNTSAPIPPQQK
jgi:mono/diheme cytochrome c family protein